MVGRRPLLLAAMAAAVFVPYWYFEHKPPQSEDRFWDGMWTDSLHDAPGSGGRWPTASSSPVAPPAGGPTLSGPPVQSLAELFRFDVSSAWIMNRWARVSTGLIEDDLAGMRVTAVSGTGSHDIAGSLTYYFDRQYQVQRIGFHGFTPDPAHVVDFVMRHHGLQPEPMLGAGLFLRRDGENWLHVMRIQHAPVVRADAPQRRYSVMLELNRPGTGRSISPRMKSLLDQDRRGRLWNSNDVPATKTPSPPSSSSAADRRTTNLGSDATA